MTSKIQLITSVFLYATLAAPINNLSSVPMAIGSWCGNYKPGLSKNPSKYQAQLQRLFAVGLLFFKVLMVSSFLLGMVLFPLKEKD